MARKKPTNKPESVTVTGEATDGSFNDTGFDMDKVEQAAQQPKEIPMNYFALSGDHTLSLQISVSEALSKGYKLAGGVSSYFDNALGRRVFIQAVVKE